MSGGFVKSINLFMGEDCTLHLTNIHKTRYSILWTRIDKNTNSYLLTIGVLNKALRSFIGGTIDMWRIWNIETLLSVQNLDLKEKLFFLFILLDIDKIKYEIKITHIPKNVSSSGVRDGVPTDSSFSESFASVEYETKRIKMLKAHVSEEVHIVWYIQTCSFSFLNQS